MSDFYGRVRKVVGIWVDAFAKHDLLTYASAIAFHVLKSLIPIGLLGVALLGATGRQDVWTTNVAPALHKRLDPTAFRAADFAVKKIFAHDSAPLIAFAALLTVWYVSGGVRGIMGGINRIYEVDDNRPFWTRWPISFGLAVCVGAGVVGAAMLIEAVPTPHGAWEIPVAAARWIGAIVALAAAAGLLVRLGPVERRPKRWASAGTALVIGAWIVASVIFKLFVSDVANFKTATGELTVFLVLIGYVYTSAIIFLVGVEVDELLREDATTGERGVLHLLFGIGK